MVQRFTPPHCDIPQSMPNKRPAKRAVKTAAKKATQKTAARKPSTRPLKKKAKPTRTPESSRCTTLQHRIANRARLVLSLCDQRKDTVLSLPTVADGMNVHLEKLDYNEHSMVSRLLRAHRNWRPDHIAALAEYAEDLGVAIDVGWLSFGQQSKAPTPIIPFDCPLRDNTDLDGVPRSEYGLATLRLRHRGEKVW